MIYEKKDNFLKSFYQISMYKNYQLKLTNYTFQLFTSAELGWISNQESVIPREVEAFFRMKLGGYDYKLFDVSSFLQPNIAI